MSDVRWCYGMIVRRYRRCRISCLMFDAADVETEDQSAPVLVSRVKRARWPSKAQQEVERAAKRLKQLPFRHSRGWGQLLTVGQGDTGQLGLGEDIMERARPALVKVSREMETVISRAANEPSANF